MSQPVATNDDARTDRVEAIRIVGSVREILRPPSHWTARVGKTGSRADREGEMVVEVDGAPVRVTVPQGALVGDPQTTTGAWGELVEQTDGRFPATLAPAFEQGRIERLELAIGDVVEIYGEVAARQLLDDGELRDAPSRRVTVVRALIVAAGAARSSRLDREIEERFPPAQRPVGPSWFEKRREAAVLLAKHPGTKEPGHRLYRHDAPEVVAIRVAFVLAIGLAVASLVTQSPHITVWAFMLVTYVVLLRPRPARAHYRMLERSYSGVFLVPDWVWEWPFMVLVVVIPMSVMTSPLDFGATSILPVTLLAIALSIVVGVMSMRTYALHGKLLRAPPWDGSFDAFAAIEGIVEDPTPATLGEKQVAIAIGMGLGFKNTPGRDPDKRLWHRFYGDGTFLVQTEHGAVEVSPQHIVWATSVKGRHYDVKGPADYERFEIIPVDGRVLAAGWIAKNERGQLQLKARGTTPALLIATGPHGEPRDWLRRLVRTRVVSGLLVPVVAAIGVAVWIWRGA
ncbi:MAG: hypothetical protein H0T76_00940 [Nannocystis sp.]|nr:hypothetical protein [Nannocystis sp.]MBA3545026.1 hypothetical protein [Nannocystis sp.]